MRAATKEVFNDMGNFNTTQFTQMPQGPVAFELPKDAPKFDNDNAQEDKGMEMESDVAIDSAFALFGLPMGLSQTMNVASNLGDLRSETVDSNGVAFAQPKSFQPYQPASNPNFSASSLRVANKGFDLQPTSPVAFSHSDGQGSIDLSMSVQKLHQQMRMAPR